MISIKKPKLRPPLINQSKSIYTEQISTFWAQLFPCQILSTFGLKLFFFMLVKKKFKTN